MTIPIITRLRKSKLRQNIAFGIFHLTENGDSPRCKLTYVLRSVISEAWKDLKIETISFRTANEVFSFEKEREDLSFSRAGYEYQGEFGWRLGELSIWAGAIKALEKFMKTKYQYLLLLEDDISCHKDCVDIVHQILLKAPREWEVISLLTPETEFSKCGNYDDCDVVVPIYQDWSCAAYIISKRGAEKLLNSVKNSGPIDYPIDWYLWRNRPNLKVYGLPPTSIRPFELEFIESTFQQKQERRPLIETTF